MVIYVEDSDGEKYTINFQPRAYPNLMELIVNSFYSEIGECRGRGLCGTCIVTITPVIGNLITTSQEQVTLQKNGYDVGKHRLACQLPLTAALDGSTVIIRTES